MYKQWNIENDLIGTISVIFDEKIEEVILSTPIENSISLANEKYGSLELEKSHQVAEVEKFLDSYFKGEETNFDLNNLNLGKLGEFQKNVLLEQVKTPFGKTNHYKDLAIAINNSKASRAVGNALRNNPFPIIIPCHRTIKANNEIGAFAGDPEGHYKKILLEHEGKTIKNRKIVGD